jgi:hypothetical protein
MNISGKNFSLLVGCMFLIGEVFSISLWAFAGLGSSFKSASVTFLIVILIYPIGFGAIVMLPIFIYLLIMAKCAKNETPTMYKPVIDIEMSGTNE